jgi:hypothetical protein
MCYGTDLNDREISAAADDTSGAASDLQLFRMIAMITARIMMDAISEYGSTDDRYCEY